MDSLGLWICHYQMCTTSYVKNSAVYHLFPGQNLYGPHYYTFTAFQVSVGYSAKANIGPSLFRLEVAANAVSILSTIFFFIEFNF